MKTYYKTTCLRLGSYLGPPLVATLTPRGSYLDLPLVATSGKQRQQSL